MKNKIAMIGEGGGMRNAIVAGFVVGAGLSPEDIDAYYGSSSSIGNGLYFATGQSDQAFEMWVTKLTSPNVLSYSNAFRGKYVADMDHVVNSICSSLDIGKLKHAKLEIIASVVKRLDGEVDYLELNEDNYKEVFKAACSIPYMSKPVVIDGIEYVDGGMGDNLPVLEAYDDGYRNFIILNNQNKITGYTAEFAKALLDKMSEKGLRNAIKNLVKNYYEAWEFIENPPSDVKIYQFLPTIDQTISKFERDPTKVRAVYLQGVGLGKTKEKEVAEFIESIKGKK